MDRFPFDSSPDPIATSGRLCHLVFLDGRLVDAWTEDAERTEYARLVRALEPVPSTSPLRDPVDPPWVRTLAWLEDVVGGPTVLRELTTDPLPPYDLPGDVPEGPRAVLADLAARWFAAELRHACDAALAHAWTSDRRFVDSADPAALAAAIGWLVGRANGVTGAAHGITQSALAQSVGLPRFPTALASRVKRELVGIWPMTDRPWGVACPDLVALRHADLLTSVTRRELVRLRDEAEARGRAVLPSEVES